MKRKLRHSATKLNGYGMNERIDLFLSTHLPLHVSATIELRRCFSIDHKKKKTQLIKEGNRTSHAYYLISGAARSFYLRKGKEVCNWFAFEGELIGNLQCYFEQPSTETVELLEDAQLIIIDLYELKKLAARDLAANILIRKLLEAYTQFLEEVVYHLRFSSSMEKYEALLQKEPNVLQRVSLTNIASYLNMSRETLSRIRKH